MSTDSPFPGLSTDALRAAVRSVLREVLPADVLQSPSEEVAGGEVTIRNDAELTDFIRRIAAACSDADQLAALSAGRHGFRLAPGGVLAPAPEGRTTTREPGGGGRGAGQVMHVERGAVTERAVQRAAADGHRLVLGRRAVLTPLARDKARSLGVAVEKES